MYDELTIKIIGWLIVTTGTITLAFGLLYLSFYLVGEIVKLTGYWKVFLTATANIYRERNKKNH